MATGVTLVSTRASLIVEGRYFEDDHAAEALISVDRAQSFEVEVGDLISLSYVA